MRTALKYRLATQLWDNGSDHFDRLARTWRDPVKLAIIQNAVKGVNNTLVAYNQEPALYFSPAETLAANRTVAIDWNGNTLRDVRLGSAAGRSLKKGKDYTATSTGITFSPTYLTTLLSSFPAAQLGALTSLYIIPSKGAVFPLSITRHTLPTIANGQTSFTVTDTSSPFAIPVASWGGTKLATVRAVKSDGAILKDDWTQWLGELQRGRLSWGDFDTVEGGVTLSTGLLGLIKGAGGKAVLTLEFWPRVAGNVVDVEVNVV